jgi:hypothetical protein
MVADPDNFGGRLGKLAIAQNEQNLRTFCDDPSVATPPTNATDPMNGPANPARSDPPSAVSPAAGAPPADDGPDNRVDTDRSACVLVTVSEVGAAMQQSVTANPADPYGASGAQGCEFDSAGAAFTSITYFPANGAFAFESFYATAEPNGVQAVPALGDRAFSYVGDNGPGLVVAKGDKVFTVEFNGIGSEPTEKNSLLQLAQQAVGRVH